MSAQPMALERAGEGPAARAGEGHAAGRAAGAGAGGPAKSASRAGRPFLNPAFDWLLIAGGLSALALPVVVMADGLSLLLVAHLPVLILLGNSAHFASSTVRLYSKPGAREALPFLTMGFPLVALAVTVACLAWPGPLGEHLVKLYLTWSPYHYAAQAYGIAVVYAFRSGLPPSAGAKRLLFWSAMLPFFHAALWADGVGVRWLLPEAWLRPPAVALALAGAVAFLRVASFAAPVALFLWLWRRGTPLPAISLLTILVNASWWLFLPPIQAFVWATVFHGIQYLAIVTIFHVKDQMARPGNAHRPAWHVATFYAACLALGWALFNVLPEAGMALGFGAVESLLVVSAAINIHHFVVDAFIWRLKPGDGNRRIAEAPPEAARTLGTEMPEPA